MQKYFTDYFIYGYKELQICHVDLIIVFEQFIRTHLPPIKNVRVVYMHE